MDLKNLFIGTVIRLFLQKVTKKGTKIYELLSASFQGVKRLFFLGYVVTACAYAHNEASIKGKRKHFLLRGKIEHYNVLTDGRNFYDQPITDLIKQFDEVRKVSTGQGDDYTTGCLFDYSYFKKSYRITAVDLSKKKN